VKLEHPKTHRLGTCLKERNKKIHEVISGPPTMIRDFLQPCMLPTLTNGRKRGGEWEVEVDQCHQTRCHVRDVPPANGVSHTINVVDSMLRQNAPDRSY
jgi:hypothetical protein